MKRCLKKAMTAIGIVKAVISRCLFAAHGFVCIWRVVVMKGDPLYWCLTGSLPLLILEGVFTLKKKKGREWKWICPSVLLYLATTVPAIWFLELNLLDRRILAVRTGGRASENTSGTEKITVWNSQISIPVLFAPDDWCKILEQMMLLILIIGRWLLPKGEITREQLSQLLLVYIGMAADIIELFEAFKEKEVRYNKILTMIILSMWTASLMQFTFVLTATKSKRMRPVLFHSGSSASTVSMGGGKSCCPTEVISIMISVVLQDGPFLVMRMMLIFRYSVLSYTNLFFTSKNTLVLVLQFYRLLVLFCQKKDKSTLVITKDGSTATDARAKTRSGKMTGTPKLPRKMSLDVTVERPDTLAERRRSSLMRQDSITDSSQTQDTDVIDLMTEQSHDDNDGDIEDEAAEASVAAVLNEDPSTEKGKSNKKGKKKKKKKEDKLEKEKSKLTLDDKDHWADVRKMAKALAFLNETGKCRTVVVNTGGNEHRLLIVDEASAKEMVGKGH